MYSWTETREPPEGRRRYCDNGGEVHLTEAAVMIAFAMHLILVESFTEVDLHPDGEHAKRFDIRSALEHHGFELVEPVATNACSGRYRCSDRSIRVAFTPGKGDVVARGPGGHVAAECKGGVINSNHPGQTSRLRRGLCEAVGLLMVRPASAERQVAVVPATQTTRRLAERMAPRAATAGIEVALVGAAGDVEFVRYSGDAGHVGR